MAQEQERVSRVPGADHDGDAGVGPRFLHRQDGPASQRRNEGETKRKRHLQGISKAGQSTALNLRVRARLSIMRT